jgi:glycosyltransferase involved in cell wall biosynthesis
MNKSGTICLFNSSTSWGGGEKWIQETGINLSGNKYHIVVCTNPSSELFNNLKNKALLVTPVRLANLSYLNPLKILNLYRIFKKHHVDIIVLGLSQDLKAAGLAAKLAGVRQIIYRRGLANPIKNNLINRFYFKSIVTKVIANSEEVKRSLLVRNSFLMNSSDIHIIYNGINLTEILTNNKSINGSPVIIGNVGRLIEGKGQKYLIELAAILKEFQFDFLIKIVGIGKMRHQLEEYAKNLKVENSIIFVEFLNDTSDFYREIDIFVFPSFSEGCSNALLEAMASSRPVVAFNISSMPEMVDDGVTGFLVPYKDVKTMAEKVTLLINSASLRKEMGDQARLKISTKFDFNKNLKLLEELF